MAISVETLALAKKSANKAIEEALSSVYSFKGSVETVDDLPVEGNKVGDTYDVIAEGGQNYSWTGTQWDALGINQIATKDRLGLVKLGDVSEIEEGSEEHSASTLAIKTYVENKFKNVPIFTLEDRDDFGTTPIDVWEFFKRDETINSYRNYIIIPQEKIGYLSLNSGSDLIKIVVNRGFSFIAFHLVGNTAPAKRTVVVSYYTTGSPTPYSVEYKCNDNGIYIKGNTIRLLANNSALMDASYIPSGQKDLTTVEYVGKNIKESTEKIKIDLDLLNTNFIQDSANISGLCKTHEIGEGYTYLGDADFTGLYKNHRYLILKIDGDLFDFRLAINGTDKVFWFKTMDESDDEKISIGIHGEQLIGDLVKGTDKIVIIDLAAIGFEEAFASSNLLHIHGGGQGGEAHTLQIKEAYFAGSRSLLTEDIKEYINEAINQLPSMEGGYY